MPMFEYLCLDCGAKFEELVTSNADSVECPKCHSPKAERQLSVFAAGASGGTSGSLPSCARPGCGSGGFG